MSGKKGILLVNLGTPDSPQTSDVRKYLKEFLLDERVIDIPAIPRNLLVRGIIAPFRAPKSAKLYNEIWMKEGSPLLVYSELFRNKLAAQLGSEYVVELAMRYQSPSIHSALEKLRAAHCSSITVVPLFPQYASASNGSVMEKVMEITRTWFSIPEMHFISSFHDHPLFIQAFVENGARHQPENYDHVLFSFHGLPERQIIKSSEGNNCLTDRCCDAMHLRNQRCYRAQCFDTARRIATALNIPTEKYTVCFQSRLGKTPWVKPYTSDVIEELANKGVKKVLAFSPAFVADCLETIYEITIEYQTEFKKRGGETLQLVESLNDSDTFVECISSIVGKIN